ncbi:MAG: TonB-dependent receptor [Maricaulaceae bacterium]|nr:TonB-dependent receptor [Maricaulaceae bacterium]
MKLALMAGAAAAAFAASPAAFAQEGEAATAGRSGDIVTVTARRREESLQDVPMSMSALGEDRLDMTGAADITALQQQTPNATVQIARGSNSTLISFIRGVGQQDPLWGFEPGVGLYVDDVYIARPQAAVLDIFDVQRIEVLRGPQGTLYGRNTIGGAIKYVTRRLSDDPSLSGRVNLGSYNQRELILTGSGAIADGLRVGGSVARYLRDGYGTNLTTGADHYDRNVTAYRASVEYEPSADWFFRAAYDRIEDNSNPRHGHRLLPSAFPGGAVLSNVYDTRAGIGDDNRVTTEGWSLTAEYRISDAFTFKSITARRRGHTDTVIDFDNMPQPTLDIPAFYSDRQFTQEFQLLYEGDRAQGVFGVYYLDGTAAGAFDTVLGVLGLTIGTGGVVETESFAAFGDVNFDLSDRLSLSVGARWTRDEKTGTVFRATYLGAGRTPLTGGPNAVPIVLNTDYTNSRSFSEFTPRISLSYRLTDDVTGYVSYSRGFKSGGFDMRGDASVTPDTVNGYNPETVSAYEAGLRGDAFGGAMTFGLGAFYADYQDRQVTTQVPAGATIASFVDNVASSTMYGVEFEGSARLGSNLTANFAVGWLQADFEEFIRYDLATASYIDVSDIAVVQNAPEWTSYLGLTWTAEAFGGQLAVTPSVSYRGAFSMFEFPDPTLDQGSYAIVDLSVVWDSPDGHWRVGLYGRNLTDERYRVGGYNFTGALFDNSIIGFYGPPRTATLSIGFRY